MPSKRDLVRENKRTLLYALILHLNFQRSSYGPHASEAADQLVAEFARRANHHEGPPPGHAQLPGLEAEHE